MSESTSNLSRQRFEELLETLAKQGLTQRNVAEQVNIPAQYVSNLKTGQRTLTELAARRFGAVFDCNYQWLLGHSDDRSVPDLKGSAGDSPGRGVPVFDELIEGDPRSNTGWDGATVELSGAAAARATQCHRAYVLRSSVEDVDGRIRQGDLLLISQSVESNAEIQVVQHRKRLLLTRIGVDGQQIRISDGQALAGNCEVVGHCAGIVWASMLKD
ncbi:MAG: transcriptional regulator with XRE-family HTH domain [Planctomycetaceae bacterium]|jgi:transcriptional regulator with XRE-family HTH domain